MALMLSRVTPVGPGLRGGTSRASGPIGASELPSGVSLPPAPPAGALELYKPCAAVCKVTRPCLCGRGSAAVLILAADLTCGDRLVCHSRARPHSAVCTVPGPPQLQRGGPATLDWGSITHSCTGHWGSWSPGSLVPGGSHGSVCPELPLHELVLAPLCQSPGKVGSSMGSGLQPPAGSSSGVPGSSPCVCAPTCPRVLLGNRC